VQNHYKLIPSYFSPAGDDADIVGEINQRAFYLRADYTGDSLTSRIYNTESNSTVAAIYPSREGSYLAGNYINRIWLMNIEEDGDSLWSKFYGAEGYYYDCCSMVGDFNRYLVLAGTVWPQDDEGDPDVFLMMLDFEGDSLWYRSYDICEAENDKDICYSMVETFTGGNGFLLAGSTTSNDQDYFAWALRTNLDGDSLWSYQIGGALEDVPYNVEHNWDFFALTGGFIDNERGIINYGLVKLSYAGEFLSMRRYSSGRIAYATALSRASGNGFLLAGTTADGIWLLKVDQEGDSLWSLPINFGHDAFCSAITYTMYSGLALTGYTESPNNAFLVETTRDPETSVSNSHIQFPVEMSLYPVFPNPFNSTVTIPFAVGARRAVPLHLAIFDPLGRRVAELIPSQVMCAGLHSVVWDAKGVPAGGYVVRLEAGEAQIEQQIILAK